MKEGGIGARILEGLTILVVAVCISALIRMFLFQAFWIPSGSMKPTLEIRDTVIASRLTPGIHDVRRGDVVVFEDQLGWSTKSEPDGGFAQSVNDFLTFVGLRANSSDYFFVKRVIGVGGDHVRCCTVDGQLEINGQAVSEPYLAPGADNAMLPFDITVPDGHLWVMGDNRNNSADSRFHMGGGQSPFVPVDSVVGRVWRVILPFGHFSDPNHNEIFATVPEPVVGKSSVAVPSESATAQ